MSHPERTCAECERQAAEGEAETFPCLDDDGSPCPVMTSLEHEDRRALRLYTQAGTLAEVGLAPLVLDVARLRLTRPEAEALVDRLVIIAQMAAAKRQADAEARRNATNLDDEAPSARRRRRR